MATAAKRGRPMALPAPRVRPSERQESASSSAGAWREVKGLAAFALASFVVMVAIPANVLYSQIDKAAGGSMLARPAGGAGADRALAQGLSDAQGRRLQTATTSTAFEYWTRTEMTLCSLATSGVLAADFKTAIRKLYGYTSTAYDERFSTQGAGVTKSSGSDATKCISTSGLSASEWAGEQFNVLIYNPPADTTDPTATPASTDAATQVDTVHNSATTFFKNLVADVPSSASSPALVATNMFVSQLGFIVGFVDTSAVSGLSTSPSGTTIGGHNVYWPWWAWLLYAGIIACCLLPLVVCVCKRRKETEAEEVDADYVAKARQQEGLSKIYGPEWGITEVDFEEDYMHYEDRDMQAEYEGAHASGAAAGGGNRGGAGTSAGGDVSDAAWEQQAGAARSDWAAPRKEEGGNSQNMAARRFDIDEDADGGKDGEFQFDD